MKLKLPVSKQEWLEIKDILMRDHGLEDDPKTWIFVLSQIQNTKMPDLETDYETVVNHYHRWKIASVLQDQKLIEIEKLQSKLKEEAEKMAKDEHHGSEEDLSLTINHGPRDIEPQWSDVQIEPQSVS